MHEALRTKGESPATLGALSRAYANLGMLTDTQWEAAPWVYKARGLLYAERLRQRDPKGSRRARVTGRTRPPWPGCTPRPWPT